MLKVFFKDFPLPVCMPICWHVAILKFSSALLFLPSEKSFSRGLLECKSCFDNFSIGSNISNVLSPCCGSDFGYMYS